MGLVRVSFLKGSSRRHDTFVVCANVSLFESKLLTRWITFSINQIRAFVVCGYPGRPTILDLVTSYVHTLTSPKIRGGFLSLFGLFRGRGWVFLGPFRGGNHPSAPPPVLIFKLGKRYSMIQNSREYFRVNGSWQTT